ncbi:hypothetical protein FRB97_001154 [Tulasnella sp. 331]|nr:hypothetical protein FRB97_001154 [Tulasnella sp. 331]
MQTSVDDVQSQPPADQPCELLKEQPERSEEEGRRGGEGEAATEAVPGEVNSSGPSPDDHTVSTNDVETSGVDGVPQPVPSVPSETSPMSSVKSNVAQPPAAIKRFSSATISKQTFMMMATSSQNSTSILGSQSSKNSNAGSSATSRLAQANSSAHPSRLVTSKLATTGVVSSAASTAGWTTASKAGSSTSSIAPSPANTPGVGQGRTLSVSNGFHSLDKAKTIGRNASPGKPWGDVAKGASELVLDTAKDFPTAAEVVTQAKSQNRASKILQAKLEAEVAASQQQDDAFRGRHLDPNGHHWGDDTRDDSDFFETVVKFADGTQYSVPPSASIEAPPPNFETTHEKSTLPGNVSSLLLTPGDRAPNGPIRKEDRLPDDYDRSWPRGAHDQQRPPSHSKTSPVIIPRKLPSPAHSISALPSEQGDRDKVLFNERSNRLEPYNKDLTVKPPTGAWGRRESHGSASGRPSTITTPQFLSRDLPQNHNHRGKDFSDRDAPPHSAVSPITPNRPLDDRHGRTGWGAERGRQDGGRRNDMPPPPPPGAEGAAWGKNSHRKWAGRDEPTQQQSARPIPGRWNSTEHDRQPPPFARSQPSDAAGSHVSESRGSMYQRRGSTTSSAPRSPGLSKQKLSDRDGVGETTASSTVLELPAENATVEVAQVMSAPLAIPELETIPILDLEGIHKVTMHSAAERAKARRQEEEEAREAQRMRARAKAAEIELRMKQAEEAKETERKAQAEKAAEAERETKRLADLEESKRQAEAEAAARALKEEEELKQREKQAKEARALRQQAEVKVDPLMARSPSTARPKLLLLPRTIPIPMAAPAQTPVPSITPTTITQPLREQRPVVNEAQSFMLPGSAVSEAIQSLDDKHDGSLEEVDFNDMGAVNAFIDAAITSAKSPPIYGNDPARPRAIDFFVDPAPVSYAHPNMEPPRQKDLVVPTRKDDLGAGRRLHTKMTLPDSAEPISAPDITNTTKMPTTPPTHSNARNREVSWDITMARFKGALEDTRGRPLEPGFLGEVHRSANSPPTVLGLATVSQMPAPIPSAASPLTVKLSKQPARTAVPEMQLKVFGKRDPPHSWDILTWDPPISNLSRKTLSWEELFVANKSRLIKVNLPKAKSKPVLVARAAKVRLPPSVPAASSQPGISTRSTRAAGMDEESWRKPNNVQALLATIPEIDPVSRSPPPIAVSNDVSNSTAIQIPSSDALSKEMLASPPATSRGKGKLPVVADVAFYLPVEAKFTDSSVESQVRFTVTSEVDDSNDEGPSNSFTESNSEGKTLDETPSSHSASTLLTPPSVHATAAWSNPAVTYSVNPVATEVGSERIKAMWDQAAHDGSNTENSLKNSLKGIADEAPTIPLSIQDMKSDDGDSKRDVRGSPSSSSPSTQTDPPAPRRSLLDIHRAFQVVPPANKTTPSYQTPDSYPPSHPTPMQSPNPVQTQSHPVPQPFLPVQLQQPQSQPPAVTYPMQQFSQQHVPGLMWGPSNQYPINAPNPHRLQAPAPPAPGPSPPLAQQQAPWSQQVQYTLSPQQLVYMPQRPVLHPVGNPTGMNSHAIQPGQPHPPHAPQVPMYPSQRSMSNQGPSGPPQAYSPRPSPHMYSVGAVGAPHGYGVQIVASGPGRGLQQPQARGGFELPPSVPNGQMYQQQQQQGRLAGWP